MVSALAMSGTEPIHTLLDRYMAALRAKRSLPSHTPTTSPDVTHIRRQLVESGFHDRDDVVDFLAWTGHPRLDESFQLFWETGSLFETDAAIREQQENTRFFRKFRAENGGPVGLSPEEQQRHYPGPAHWLPVLYLGGTQYLSVDCRPDPIGGSVWFLFVESENQRVFDSLAEGIEAAVYCIEAGLWQVDERGVTCPERAHGPGAADRDSPPWVGYGDQPTARLMRLDPGAVAFVHGETRNGPGLQRARIDLAQMLTASGCETVTWTLEQVTKAPRQTIMAAVMPEEHLGDPSVTVIEVNPASLGCYFLFDRPNQGGPLHRQWMTPTESEQLTALGFEVMLDTENSLWAIPLEEMPPSRPLDEIVTILKASGTQIS